VINQIVHVAVHDLVKSESGFGVKLGKGTLAVNKTTQRVVDEMYKLYSRRSSKTHGKFTASGEPCATEQNLKSYVEGGGKDFAVLTGSMMETLAKQAGYRGAAQGGHVFFAHYTRENRHFLLVAIVNDKLGAALTRELDVQDTQYLDIEGFRFAGRINVSGWASSEERYIGFLKGKGDVSEYFKEFLGCETTVQERKDTADLVAALKAFADSQKMSAPDREDFLQRAKSICDRSAKSRQELEFEALANELMPTSPSTLLDVLTDPDLNLNDGFIPNRRVLGSLVRFKAKTELWSLEFERSALSGGKVVFDPDRNTLTLTDLPADLSQELREEFADATDV